MRSGGEKCAVRGNITVSILALFLVGSPFFSSNLDLYPEYLVALSISTSMLNRHLKVNIYKIELVPADCCSLCYFSQ